MTKPLRVCVMWETRCDDNATTVANPSTSPPGPPKAILAQGHFGSSPFWLKASLAQGHQMVALVVVMAMVALMVIVMNDVGDRDDRSISMVLP